MIVKKNILRSAVTVLFSTVLISLSQGPILAAAATSSSSTTKTATANPSTNTLKVSPLRTDLTIQPGTSAVVKTYVTNLTDSPIAIEPIENDFIAGPDENGAPAIILNQNQYAPTHSLKRFMEPLPASVTVPADGTSEIVLTISVPKTAQAGGYFGAVRYAPVSSSGGQSVNLSASIASLILMTVPGPTVEQLDLTNFNIQQNGTTTSSFRTPKNISLLLRFENEGNLQEAPFGQIYVEKGKKVVFTDNFNQNDPKDEVLPDSARRWSIPLSGFSDFGKYTVGAALTYGVNKSQSIDVSKTFWIIPTELILGVVGGIVLLVLIIVAIWFFLRSYKRRVLRSRRYR